MKDLDSISLPFDFIFDYFLSFYLTSSSPITLHYRYTSEVLLIAIVALPPPPVARLVTLTFPVTLIVPEFNVIEPVPK